jgi:hypothetical protein
VLSGLLSGVAAELGTAQGKFIGVEMGALPVQVLPDLPDGESRNATCQQSGKRVLQRELRHGGDAPHQGQRLVKPRLQPIAVAQPSHLPQKQQIPLRLRDPLPTAKIDGNCALGLPRGFAAGDEQGFTPEVGNNGDQGSERSGEQIPQPFGFFFFEGLEIWAAGHGLTCWGGWGGEPA